jgi:PAS domain S-box-containing protein
MSMSSDEYRKYVQDNLDRMTEIFAHISMGDFTGRIDPLSLDPDDQFTQALCGLDMMMDDIIDARKDLKSAAEKLEREVRQRTAELTAANEKCTIELVERKQSEENFAEREKFYTDIFNSIQDPISILDSELNIVSTNTTMEMWYKEILPIVGKKCYWVYHHRDKPCEKCPSIQTIRTGKAAFEVVPKRDSFGKQIGWSALYSFPWKNAESGEIRGVIEYIKDISELRLAEEKIRESEARFRTLAETASAGIFIVKDSKFVYVNSYIVKVCRYAKDELLAMYFWQVVHPEFQDVMKKRYTDRMYGREAVSDYEFKFVRKDGTVGWASLNVGLIEFEGGPALIGTLFDITERKRAEEELFKARKLESLGVLAGGIAHDFNNILTGIITNLFMAKMKVKSDPDTYQLLAEAEKASFRASKLVKQLLTFSKGGAPVKEAVSIRSIIEDSVGFCLSGSNVNYKLSLASDLLPVEADKGQIDQVLNNLIINADQAMPNGGTATVSAENVTVDDGPQTADGPKVALQPGRYVKVTVKDEGMGIPRENLEKIFDPYFSTKPNGNGLGLTIAYSIVKAHKGVITVDSVVGKGTVFSFYLPVVKEQKTSEGKNISPMPSSGNGQRILIMDDDSAVRSVLMQLLKNAGYVVVCTASGSEAIAAYAAAMKEGNPFTVVVMDLTIPGGMDGKQAVAEVLKLDPLARVVVASGYSNDPIMANFRDYGFCGVIAKPFNIDEFLDVVSKASAAETA